MKRFVQLALAILACIVISACSGTADSGEASTQSLTHDTAVSTLAGMEDSETASFDGVSTARDQGYSTSVGTHEDELAQAGYEKADIGIPEIINGVETNLVIPMWYGEETLYETDMTAPIALSDAEEDAGFLGANPVWIANPVATVEFHMDNGVLIIDKLIVPQM